ncbi:hypothetical protein B0H19DRAFT_1077942 [Mycena capillaripes]|nr:hypothetical protein B0H19DRAFT_1077942 [Mycena capillaripes]
MATIPETKHWGPYSRGLGGVRMDSPPRLWRTLRDGYAPAGYRHFDAAYMYDTDEHKVLSPPLRGCGYDLPPTVDEIFRGFKVVETPTFNDTWAEFERIHASGRAQAIGPRAALQTAKILPAVNQVESFFEDSDKSKYFGQIKEHSERHLDRPRLACDQDVYPPDGRDRFKTEILASPRVFPQKRNRCNRVHSYWVPEASRRSNYCRIGGEIESHPDGNTVEYLNTLNRVDIQTVAKGVAAGIFPTQEGLSSDSTTTNRGTIKFTTDEDEVNVLVSEGYALEGIAGYVYKEQVCGAVPLFRSYNSVLGDHFFTTSKNEHAAFLLDGYVDQGIAAYVPLAGAVRNANVLRSCPILTLINPWDEKESQAGFRPHARLQCIIAIFLTRMQEMNETRPLLDDSRFVYIEQTTDYRSDWLCGAHAGEDY